MKRIGWFIGCLSLLFCSSASAENLLLDSGSEGDAAGWPAVKGVSYRVEHGLLNVTVNGGSTGTEKRILLKPEWKYVLLSMKMKLTGVVSGKQGWRNGRLAMRFFDKKREGTGPWPDVFGGSGTSELRECTRLYEIPPGAVYLEIAPTNLGKSGTVEFREMKLEPLSSLKEMNLDAPIPGRLSRERQWDISDAFRIATSTRETVCMNGLWNFFPVRTETDAKDIPDEGTGWGWFKVPGVWPGMGWGAEQPGDNNLIVLSPMAAAGFDPAGLNTAWYRRTVAIPAEWSGKRISLEITMLQTCARIFIDGKKSGELYYPGGKIDLTERIRPGKTQEIILLVSAKNDGLTGSVFMAPGRLVKSDAGVSNRGITGDMFLTAEPSEAAVSDVHVITSWRKKRITCDVGIASAVPGDYYLEAEIKEGKETLLNFRSGIFHVKEGKKFRRSFSADWLAPKLWDTDTPENIYVAEIRLRRADGKTVDEFFPQEFGFREFWCEGKNFMLNGSVIHLRSMASSSMREGAARSSREVARQIAERAGKAGFNHLIAYNYSFAPGIVGYQDHFYREASKAGVLTSLTMPHASHFNWALETPEERNRYLAQAEFLIRRFQNVPGIVLYAATHNAAGYIADQNPLKLDGIHTPDKYTQSRPRRQALAAGKLIASIDATRPVYHHESGNLGELITLNCYLNWVPAQERSDWLEHWEKAGAKPLILVEWGMPHTASWTSYRGPGFVYSSAKGVQCIWLNEYNAAIFGERTYQTSSGKEASYRNQEKVSAGNRPVRYIEVFPYRKATLPVCAEMVKDNFRELRGRGVSGLLPWDFELLWERTGETFNGPWPKRFENLKRPGIVPDTARGGGNFLTDFNTEYKPSVVGAAGLPWMREKIAWIAGKIGDFTEKGHNFRRGETVRKQVLVLNDSRRKEKIRVEWSVPELDIREKREFFAEPGTRTGVPVVFTVPAAYSGTMLNIRAQINFGEGQESSDSFRIDVIPDTSVTISSKIGVFDPEGKTTAVLRKWKIPFRELDDCTDLKAVELLVIGRNALKNTMPQLAGWMEKGGKLLVLEQELSVLNRLGFRGTEYGLRKLFPLVRNFHGGEIANWRGSSTLTEPYFKIPDPENSYPQWNWQGFTNSRAWRAGNRGNICSVPLEKPSAGNFLPLMQGGFDLQYTPALELKAGRGIAVFSQFDLSGRTESDPEAEEMLKKLILRLDRAEVAVRRPTWYAGDQEGRQLLENLLVSARETDTVPENGLLIVAPGAELPDLTEAVENGLNVLMLGLSGQELNALLPGRFGTHPGRYYSDYAEGIAEIPEFLGVSNADLHWRRELSMDAFNSSGPGGRALRVRKIGRGTAVAFQVAPWMFDPQEFQFRTSRRRNTGAVARLLFNLGAESRPGIWKRLFPEEEKIHPVFDLSGKWIGKADPQAKGRSEKWFAADFQADRSWVPVAVPGAFDPQIGELENYDGFFWYRTTFHLPSGIGPERECVLSLGPVDDESWVWLNGHFLGELTQKTNPDDYWAAQRVHRFSSKLLRTGVNHLAVLCNDLRGNGGILGTPAIRVLPPIRFYVDEPVSSDDPFRYFRW